MLALESHFEGASLVPVMYALRVTISLHFFAHFCHQVTIRLFSSALILTIWYTLVSGKILGVFISNFSFEESHLCLQCL